MKTYILNRILLLVGSTLTFCIGCMILLSAIYLFDDLLYSIGLQVLPSNEWIVDMIYNILVRVIIGIVLIPYSIYVLINLYTNKEI